MTGHAQDPTERIAWLRSLRAVRDFTDDPVPAGPIEGILEVARWTGSAMNKQPWELIVVRDRQTLVDLAAISPNAGHLKDAAFAIVIVLAGAWEMGEAYDEGRLTERLGLAGLAYGLGSCIGWFNTPERQAQGKERLGIPAERTLRTVLSFGIPDRAAIAAKPRREQPRKSIEETVSWEQFGVHYE